MVLGTLLTTGTVYAQQAPDELYRSGLRLFSENKLNEAATVLERVVALQPRVANGWKALGVVRAAQGDFDRAEEPFRVACKLDPTLPDACFYYGRALYLLDRFQPAIEVLRRALENDRKNAQIHRLIALSLEGAGEIAAARAEFLEAIRLESNSAADEHPGIDFAVYLFRQGRAEEALTPLETALKRYPESARAHLELGCILLSLDRLTEAETHLERAIALAPLGSRGHLLLGRVYLRLGKKNAGEEQLRQGSRTVK